MSEQATLRDQQAEFTRQLLIEAARAVILSEPPEDFTMQKVARQAGVSHRTVYRYFPTRQDLIDEYSNWLEEQFGLEPVDIRSTEQLGDLSRMVFARFDAHSEDYEAAARVSGIHLRPANQIERDSWMRQLFDHDFGDLDPAVADSAFAMLRHLIGLQTWFTLRDRFGMRDGESGETVAWAVDQLIAGLKEGNLPAAGKPASVTQQGMHNEESPAEKGGGAA